MPHFDIPRSNVSIHSVSRQSPHRPIYIIISVPLNHHCSSFTTFEREYQNMAHFVLFWLCLILVCYSLAVSEPRLLTQDIASNNQTDSDKAVPLGVKELFDMGFVFKVKITKPHALTRRSPGGPDPKHHWILNKRKLFSKRLYCSGIINLIASAKWLIK